MIGPALFVGIDIGTQGVRAVSINTQGCMTASSELKFAFNEQSRQEQSPKDWWDTLTLVLRDLANQLRKNGLIDAVQAISVTSTSGTMIPLDQDHQPLHNAIMYSDHRSGEQAIIAREAALHEHSGGYKDFQASSGLPKILWFLEEYPEKVKEIRSWVHASDYVISKLCGEWGITDYTNALKTGYDLENLRWPDYLSGRLNLPESWFPRVVPSGTPIGRLLPNVANNIGFPLNVQVVAGMTDGCASQIASGAVRLGDWNTTIGTTLVLKGVTRKPVPDPLGRIYNHRHPEGFWMPGGASNTGADWITHRYGQASLDELNQKTGRIIPTPFLIYPLLQKGERFPFIAPEAQGFQPDGLSDVQAFAAGLEGVAYLERLSYEMIEELSDEEVKTVYTAGGASNNEVWSTIRSSVLKKPVKKMKYTMGAIGSAVLAASQTAFNGLEEAGNALIALEKVYEPFEPFIDQYEENYHRFIEDLEMKGYIRKGENIVG